jgi:hypothetical protein
MPGMPSNALNISQAGLVGFDGTGNFVGSTTTEYNVLVGGSANDIIANVAPSATAGIPLVSNGSTSNPSFTTAVVAGGGTGRTTLTNHGILVGAGTTAITQLATGSAGQIIRSGGAAADPSYSTATYPSTAGTSGNVLTSDGTNWNSSAPAASSITLTGDSGGGLTGSSFTIEAFGGGNAGASVMFAGSGSTLKLNMVDGIDDLFIGRVAGNTSVTGVGRNVGLGTGALQALTNGNENVAVGYSSGDSYTSGSGNTIIGYNANSNSSTTQDSIIIGANAGINYTTSESGNIIFNNPGVTGESNTIRIGQQGSAIYQQDTCYIAGIVGVTVSNQEYVTINSSTGQLGVTSSAGIGTIAGDSGSATGSTITFNAFGGGKAGATVKFAGSGSTIDLNLADSNSNVTLGAGAGNTSLSGSQNIGIGSNALTNLGSGSYNICIGDNAGFSYNGSESGNICLLSSGVAAESNTIRIGIQGSMPYEQNACYIAGITGATVTGSAVLCSSTGQLGTIVSSIIFKENVKDMQEDVSILNLRAVEFNYKNDNKKTKQYGLIAEEVDKAFPYLCLYGLDGQPASVKYHEIPVLLLKEVQRLEKRIQELERSKAV